MTAEYTEYAEKLRRDVAAFRVFRVFRDLKLKPFWMQFRKDEGKEGRNPKPDSMRVLLVFRPSNFGLLSAFGFRPSGFDMG